MSRKGKKKHSSMPASSAGLLRFFEDETHGVKVRPEIVIILAVVMGVSSLLIRMFIPV